MRAFGRSLPAMVIVTIVAAMLGALARDACLASPDLAVAGCATDLRVMWLERGLADYRVPYLQPVLDPATGRLVTVEYPVLSGMLMWLVALASSTLRGFVALHAAVMTVCAAGVTVILHRTSGTRAWLWAASPCLIWHVAFNNDAFASVLAVGALALVYRQAATMALGRCLGAATLLGLGGAAKLYPLLLVLPLALWLLHGGPQSRRLSQPVRVRRALLVAATAVAAFALVNLPFAIANPEGWMAPFRFQAMRRIGPDSLSLWYLVGLLLPGLQPFETALATVATALGVAAVAALAWRRARRTGQFDVLAVSVAVLAAYLVLNKVFSPQYLLWLLPLLVMAAFPAPSIWVLVGIDTVLFWALQVVTTSSFLGRPGWGAPAVVVVLLAALARAAWVAVLGVRALTAPPREPGALSRPPQSDGSPGRSAASG